MQMPRDDVLDVRSVYVHPCHMTVLRVWILSDLRYLRICRQGRRQSHTV